MDRPTPLEFAKGFLVMVSPAVIIAMLIILLTGCSTPEALAIPEGDDYWEWASKYNTVEEGNSFTDIYPYDTVSFMTTYSYLLNDEKPTAKQIRRANFIYKNHDSVIAVNGNADTIITRYYYERYPNAKHSYTLKEWSVNDSLISVILIDVRWRDSFRKWLND